MKNFFGLFVIVALIALGGGCGSDDSTSGPADTTPPGVGNVMAVDANHLVVTFSESVKKETAERGENYVIIETTPAATSGTAAPGDTIHVDTAVLGSDGMTVTIGTQEAMQMVPYEINITGVEDLYGNKTNAVISNFAGSNAGDTTPPEIAQRTPAPGATNVGIGTSVVVQFNERMNFSSVQSAFSWSFNSGTVAWDMQEESDNTFVFTAQQPLMNGTMYNVSMQGTAQDQAGNPLSGGTSNWSFTTTAAADNTPPTLVSSTPANGALNVPVNSNLSLTFSEPIDQTSLEGVILSPDVGDGVETWSNGGATITFDPDVDMLDDTQYTLIIPPGNVRDLAGNGTTSVYQVTWSTGASLASGQFSGTLSGHPGTPAANPAGALVIAADSNPFGAGGDDFGIGGSGVAAGNGAYNVMYLADGWYYPIAIMDSNGDGETDPSFGDAIGAYGVDFGVDFEADSIQIVGGNSLTGIDFALYDAMAIVGTLSYDGIVVSSGPYYIGVFDVAGFNINNPPDFSTQGAWPFEPMFSLNEFDDGLAPGTYYVGAYLDANFNGTYESAVDPVGLYGGLASPTSITLGPGEDALNVDILIQDPPSFWATRESVSWALPSKADPQLRDTAARVREALAARR